MITTLRYKEGGVTGTALQVTTIACGLLNSITLHSMKHSNSTADVIGFSFTEVEVETSGVEVKSISCMNNKVYCRNLPG